MSQPYLSLEAELHDAFWDAEDDRSEERLMAGFLKKHPGPALEIGCGSGRLLLPLLKSGHEVEGLELSPDMLAICRERAAAGGLCPVLHEGDMTTWSPPRRFAALLAPAFTLQLTADAPRTLRRWHGWLQNGGGLYLTIFIPFSEIESDQSEGEWYADHEATLDDGRLARLETRHAIDLPNRILHREHRYRLSGDPRVHHSTQTLRWYGSAEMAALLADAGFEVAAAFPDFDPTAGNVDDSNPDFGGIITILAIRS